MDDLIFRKDPFGVAHAAREPPYMQSTLHTTAACELFVEDLLVMCQGPAVEYPTCLWCIVGRRAGWGRSLD